MILSFVVAMAQNRVIGRDNRLPWYLPADLRFFKRTTLGKPVIMGRRTYTSMGGPLPGRRNIVITGNPDYRAPGCIVVHSLEEALIAAEPAEEAMIIGGATIFAQTLPHVERIYLTLVHAEIEGDTWFPEFDPEQWREVWREAHPADDRHAYPYSFILLERRVPL
jgi:dihydrofolate reductase